MTMCLCHNYMIFIYMLRIGIGTCACRYSLLQYLVLEVSVKIRIGTALQDIILLKHAAPCITIKFNV